VDGNADKEVFMLRVSRTSPAWRNHYVAVWNAEGVSDVVVHNVLDHLLERIRGYLSRVDGRVAVSEYCELSFSPAQEEEETLPFKGRAV
jgi:hypothetical protein